MDIDTLGWQVFFFLFITLLMSSYCLLVRNQLLILLKITYKWWVTSLLLLSRLSLSFNSLWCGLLWVFLSLSYLKFVELLKRLIFSLNLGSFWSLFFSSIFSIPHSSSFQTSIMCMLVSLMVSYRSLRI